MIGVGSFEYSIKGVLIVISERRLGQILQMPSAGICIAKLINKSDSLWFILEREDVCEIEVLHANQLSVEMCLLHHVISRIFFPKTRRFD